jgi:Ca-activated chloride channel family protein
MPMSFSIGELADRAGVTPRTIRYYVELGLLPPPAGTGNRATYGPEHLDRLMTIKKLQMRRLSLDEIRAYLAEAEGAAPPMADLEEPMLPSSAAQYISDLRSNYEVRQPKPQMRSLTDAYTAEPWTRIPISPDIELHVRRRGSRIDTRLAKAIEELRRLFAEEEP